MLRAHKGVDVSPYLAPADLPYLCRRIEPWFWYPMEIFERLGIAILHEIARGDLKLVKHFGRVALAGRTWAGDPKTLVQMAWTL